MKCGNRIIGAVRAVRADFDPASDVQRNTAQIDYHLDYGLPGLKAGPGVNATNELNVHSIALQVPISSIMASGHPTVGIFASTQRRNNVNVLTGSGTGSWRQIERLGMPLTNEVLIGLNDKDHWNQVKPVADAQFKNYLLNPVLAAVLGAQATNRTDLVATFDQSLGLERLRRGRRLLAALCRPAVRRFAEQPTWLRFGLPGGEPEWQRLRSALNSRG